MLRVIMLLVAVLILSTHHTFGGLGETSRELETRYGRGDKKVEAEPGEAALDTSIRTF